VCVYKTKKTLGIDFALYLMLTKTEFTIFEFY